LTDGDVQPFAESRVGETERDRQDGHDPKGLTGPSRTTSDNERKRQCDEAYEQIATGTMQDRDHLLARRALIPDGVEGQLRCLLQNITESG